MSALQKLFDQLERHDWFFAMSDDHRVWRRGQDDRDRLDVLVKTIDGGTELMNEFKDYMFRGEPWGNEKGPKPVRPADLEPDNAGVMFVVFDFRAQMRLAAFASYDEAEKHRLMLGDRNNCLIEAVDEDEDLFYSINR